jgi:hypothetical protein
MITVLLFLVGAASSDVWTEPSLINVIDAGTRSAHADVIGRIYAARGERESFQLCVPGGRKGRKGLRVEAEAVDNRIGPPRVYRVDRLQISSPSARSISNAQSCPDVLQAVEPFDLPPGTLAVFWLTYDIPRDAKPGVKKSSVRVRSDKRRSDTVDVRVEVFDFELPALPSLGVVAPLDRLAVRSVYGLDAAALDAWKPVYDALNRYRISFEVWDGGGLCPVDRAGTADTSALKAHVEYAATACDMAVIELGGRALAAFPEPEPGQRLDPLAGYLREMSAWLAERQWLPRADVRLDIPEYRAAWPETRAQCTRVTQAEERLPRRLAGPPHPYFDRYVDHWAIPLRSFSPELVRRFTQGISLADEMSLPLRAVRASSCGTLPGFPRPCASIPEEACDGSLFSGWSSLLAPTAKNPEWLEMRFASAVTAETLYVVWPPGRAAPPVEVSISFAGELFSPATVTWREQPPQPYLWAVSIGTFRYPATFQALRLTFRGGADKEPVGILEVTLDPPDAPPPPQPAPTIQPWLRLEPGEYPALSADAHPLEARVIPWICWGHAFTGVEVPALNDWPRAWLKPVEQMPQTWSGAGDGSGALVYPGPKGLMTSVRLERLRDGLEDYEYLQALSKAQQAGGIDDPELRFWTQRRLYRLSPTREELDGMTDQVLDARIKIGRALHK